MLPFPGGIEATENATLAFSIVAAALYAFILEMRPSWLRSAVKTLSTALLAVLAWLLRAPDLLIVGLALGSLGDLLLSRPGDKAFLGGLASFLAAHIAYVVLFLQQGAGLSVLTLEPWRGIAAIFVAVFALSMLLVLMRRVPPAMRVPIVAYSMAILLMGVTVLTTSNWMVIAGAVLFMASDALLGWERFVAPGISTFRSMQRLAVWALYYLAQLLITLGFVL